ncbi:hypothetical protein DVR14_10280 [Natrinema thermotolerans]|nr:hypothetical protein DVR14_10280 [Natrinema thermotolerans]
MVLTGACPCRSAFLEAAVVVGQFQRGDGFATRVTRVSFDYAFVRSRRWWKQFRELAIVCLIHDIDRSLRTVSIEALSDNPL